MLVETGLDGSVWNFPAGKWNPSLNRDDPDQFWEAGGRLLGGGGLGGQEPPQLRSLSGSLSELFDKFLILRWQLFVIFLVTSATS